VGAAYGYYTLKASKLINGSVLAFDPDPVLYKVLEANIVINNVKNVKTYNMALSDVDGEINLGSSRVKARKLDTIAREEGLKFTENDVIKVDVEGMAMSVLKGAARTLRFSRPKLVIELHPREETVELFLRELGYRISKPSKYFIIAE
ncbi:FkbM family methyltransferase, partial [Candidatus Bathyarchaeota archaeon]|nr:FkbM family methyltransferase [Candidatus Bathyarchaeota archaeon]